MIHGHGDDLYRYSGDIQVNFSTNIPEVRHYGLERHLASRISDISHYPDPDASALTARIATTLGVGSDNVLVTGGAVDAIYSLARLHAGSVSAIMAPTFSEYADAAAMYGHTVVYFDGLCHVPQADMVWICNPNNPTGSVIDPASILAAAQSRPSTLWVIDQAYEDYVDTPVLTDAEAVAVGNVVLLHSMTKRYHIPGLRVGYMVAAAAVVAALRQSRMPWIVNALAIAAVDYALDRQAEFAIDTRALVAEQKRVSARLRAIGVEVADSSTNFLLARLPGRLHASDLKQWLVGSAGMLIRDASNFYGLTPSHLRVAVQGRSDNDKLVDMIQLWLQQYLPA